MSESKPHRKIMTRRFTYYGLGAILWLRQEMRLISMVGRGLWTRRFGGSRTPRPTWQQSIPFIAASIVACSFVASWFKERKELREEQEKLDKAHLHKIEPRLSRISGRVSGHGGL